MARRFLSNVRINDAYTLPASDGTNNQVIKTDGSGNLTFGQLATDSASVIYKDTFTGDGSTTAFTMANALNDENQSNIYIDGVYQSKSTYSVANKVITFSTAPASGHAIEVISTTGINSGPTAIFTDNFTANGSTTAFTLGQTVHDENQTLVFLNGVYQFKNTYTLSGTTLTLDTAPANGVAIEVMSIGSAYSGGDILYDHDFTSAGLMKTDGSGTYSIVTDNSSNWNTAYTYSQVGHLPLAGGTVSGNLIVTGDLTINGNTTTLSTQTIEVEDNILQLNTTQGSPDTATATTSGISIYRGNGVTQASFIFDDGDDTWDLTNNLKIAGNLDVDGTEITVGTNGSIFAENNLRFKSSGAAYIDHNTTGQSINFRVSNSSALDTTPLTIGSNGLSTFNGDIMANGNFLNVAQYIIHINDGDTYHRFLDDRQMFVAGNIEFIDFAETTQNYITIGGSSDIDVRMQGGSGYIFIQGSNGYIGINDDSPSYPFEVNGNTHIGGNISVSGTTFLDGDVTVGDTNSAFIGMARAGANYLAATNASGYLVFRTAGSNERMRIDSSGNVGIGTTSPAQKLEVVNSGFAYVRTRSTAGSYTGFDIGQHTGGGIFLNNRDNTAITLMTNNTTHVTFNADRTTTFAGNVHADVINNAANSANIIYRSGTDTLVGGGNASRKVYIADDGNVGISVNPGAIVAGNVRLDVGTVGCGITSRQNYELNLTANADYGTYTTNNKPATRLTLTNSGEFHFGVDNGATRTAGNAITFIRPLTILNDGKVGIGATSPSNQFVIKEGSNVDMEFGSEGSGCFIQTYNRTSSAWGYLRFIAGGGEQMRIHTDGNIGIGTTTPQNKLHVKTNASGASSFDSRNKIILENNGEAYFSSYVPANSYSGIRFHDASGLRGFIDYYHGTQGDALVYSATNHHRFLIGASEKMRLTSAGNLGIGTTSPMTVLHVQQSNGSYPDDANNHLVVESSSHSYIGLGGGTSSDVGIHFGDSGSMNQGRIAYQNSDDSLNFSTFQNVRMKITSAGNVGIGTTSPSRKLYVGGAALIDGIGNTTKGTLMLGPQTGGASKWSVLTGAHYNATSGSGNGSGSAGIMLIGSHAKNGENDVVIGGSIYEANAATSIQFWTHTTDTSTAGGTERMRINSSGNVGIGVTSPLAKLDLGTDAGQKLYVYANGNVRSGFGIDLSGSSRELSIFHTSSNGSDGDISFGYRIENSSGTYTERMRLTGNGRLIIGGTAIQTARTFSVTTNTHSLTVDNCTTSSAGNGTEYQTFRRHNGSNAVQIGAIVMNGTSGITYATSSDYRLKENVVELTNALDRVDQLKPSRFNFISDESRTIDGFLAHEVSDIVPEAIVGIKDEVDEDGNPKYQSIDQSKLVPLLVGAIKELKAEIEQLKTQING